MRTNGFTRRSLTRCPDATAPTTRLPTVNSVRVAIIAESFLPQVNGVVNSVLRVLEHLHAEGHQCLVITPAGRGVPSTHLGFPVVTVPAFGLPGYSQVRVATTTRVTLRHLLDDWAPDVVHLASPFALGFKAAIAAHQLNVPVVAVYQTEIPAYAAHYGFPGLEALLWHRVRQVHGLAHVTLAPSRYTRDRLVARGIPRVEVWARGVDTDLFRPERRSSSLRARLCPHGERLIGYMGRLAKEKQIDDLAVLSDLPGTQLVIIGDGPRRADLQSELPQAHFLGQLSGQDLAQAVASLDVFVHPGELETFGQAIQEALASGVPVVAPACGGPLDLVNSSYNGWLYSPGDLASLREHVVDLIGDDAKRRAMGRASRASTESRTWPTLCADLMRHYDAARAACSAPIRSG